MMDALKILFTSKKFLMAIAATLVTLGAKYGLNLDPELIALIVGTFATAIIGQGIADHGKEAAKINADKPAANSNNVVVQTGDAPTGVSESATTTPIPTVKSGAGSAGGGGAQLSLMLIVLLSAGFAMTTTACSGAKDTLVRVAGEFTDCEKPSLKSVWADLLPLAAKVVEGAIMNDGKLDFSQIKSVAAPLKTSASRCAIATAIAEATRPPTAGAPAASPLAANAEETKTGFKAMSTELWEGEMFKTSAGSL